MSTDWDTAEATTDPDAFAFDGDGMSSDDLGSDDVKLGGWYHLECVDVVPDLGTVNKQGKPKSPSIRFDLVVLQSVDGQSAQGSRHFHRIWVGAPGGGPAAEGSRNSAFRFGLSLGLLREIERDGRKAIVDAATGSTRITLNTWMRAKGMQMVAELKVQKDEKYGDKIEIPFGRVHQVDDPEVAKVPKNAQALRLIGKGAAPANGTSAPTASKPASAPASAPAAQPTTTAADDFSDL